MLFAAQDLDSVAWHQVWLNTILLWVGFGALVGLCADALTPGSDRRRSVSTLLAGLGGAVFGPLLIDKVFQIENFNPVGIFGFFPAVLIGFLLLVLFRSATFSYDVYAKMSDTDKYGRKKRTKRRRREPDYYYEDEYDEEY